MPSDEARLEGAPKLVFAPLPKELAEASVPWPQGAQHIVEDEVLQIEVGHVQLTCTFESRVIAVGDCAKLHAFLPVSTDSGGGEMLLTL